MTQSKKYLLRNMTATALLCAGFVSCSHDDMPDDGTLADGKYPLEFTASVEGMQSRASGKDVWTDGDEIGVRIGADGAVGRYRLNADGTVKEAVTPVYWQDTLSTYVKAWYPYAPQENVDISNQSRGFAAFDFLAVTAEGRNYTSSTDLILLHSMAKVSCTLQKGDGITDEDLAAATVRIAGYTKASFAEGELTGSGDGWITPASDGDVLLVPQDMTGTPFIQVSFNGKIHTYTPDNELHGKLIAGYHNSYTIIMTADGIEVTETIGGQWSESDNVEVVSLKNDLSTAKVGDIITVSGKLIDKEDLSKLTVEDMAQVAGVVFWTPAETDYTPGLRQTPARLDDDKILVAEHPNCTHGLAVAVKQVTYNDCDTMVWQPEETHECVKDWQASVFAHANKDQFVSVASTTDATGNINKIYGYQNTVVLRAYNEYCQEVKNRSGYIVRPVASLDEFVKSNTNPAPVNSTGWFLPSAKELHILSCKDVDNIYHEYGYATREIVNASLIAVGGDKLEECFHWTSSEYNSDRAFRLNPDFAKLFFCHKNNFLRVRAVCAF